MSTAESTRIITGNIVFTRTPHQFDIVPNGYIILKGSQIVSVESTLPAALTNVQIQDYSGQLIIPGFVDLHVHAAQYGNLGLALDLELLEWLQYYTYPEEARFSNALYAETVYKAFSQAILQEGTTSAAVYGTLHGASSVTLAEILYQQGLRAFVGKVSMDLNAPDNLREDTAEALRDAEIFINSFATLSDRVRPIITPRFVPSCSDELLNGLGMLAARCKVPVQSHLSESRDEVALVTRTRQKPYAKIYYDHGLLGQLPTLMAHCIYLEDDEIDLLTQPNIIAVHCPNSNMNLASGIMPVRKLLNRGVRIGLGSDIAAGHSLSMRDSIVRAIQCSKMIWCADATQAGLSLPEAFYLATKGGGQLWGDVGSFEPGYQFDALVINPDLFSLALTVEEQLQRFIYGGQSFDITARYVAGQEVKLLT